MNGELRHETCRFGRLTEAWFHEHGRDTPVVVPLCTWNLPEATPPAILRWWGGGVKPERDCVGCSAHRAVEVAA